MIVLDASAALELMLGTEAGRLIAKRIANPEISLHAPHLVDIEIIHALRRYVHEGEIDAAAAKAALDDFRSLDIERHAHEPLLDRIWELRENVTAYDAAYIALAEVLDAILITCDGKLARAPRTKTAIEFVGN